MNEIYQLNWLRFLNQQSFSFSVKKSCVVYVDYAYPDQIAVISTQLSLQTVFSCREKINWSIEGKALAIKQGVKFFLQGKKPRHKTLIIYTDHIALLAPFHSKTRAGDWWWEAWGMAQEQEINLVFRWTPHLDNLAAQLIDKTKSQTIRCFHNYKGYERKISSRPTRSFS